MTILVWTIVYALLLWWGWHYLRDARWHGVLWMFLLMLWSFIAGLVAARRPLGTVRSQPWRKMKP